MIKMVKSHPLASREILKIKNFSKNSKKFKKFKIIQKIIQKIEKMVKND